MILDLTDTVASKVAAAFVEARHRAGIPAIGMVGTLVIVTGEAGHYDALRAAQEVAREHPARILVVVGRPGRGKPRLDAEVRFLGDSGPGETAVLRLHAELADHAESVLLPLLLPDAPVIVWWPGEAPTDPAKDPVGHLAQRRITDAAATAEPLAALESHRDGYQPGDTDFAWTRITSWRTVLAATLDKPGDPITGGLVACEPGSASSKLLALWLSMALKVPIEQQDSDGPGITEVRLDDHHRRHRAVPTRRPPRPPEPPRPARPRGRAPPAGHRGDPLRGDAQARPRRRLWRRPGPRGAARVSVPEVVVHRDATVLAEAIAARLVTGLVDAQASQGHANLVLTGGTIGTALLASVRGSTARDAVDWSRLDIWWGDERFVAEGSPDRNDGQARAALLDHVPIPEQRIHPIAGSSAAATPEEAADRYARELAAAPSARDGVPPFDVLLLGIGPDAHVASLFPENPAVHETEHTVVAVHGAPKPPPDPGQPHVARHHVRPRGVGRRRRSGEGDSRTPGPRLPRRASPGTRLGRTRAATHLVPDRRGGGLSAPEGPGPDRQRLTPSSTCGGLFVTTGSWSDGQPATSQGSGSTRRDRPQDPGHSELSTDGVLRPRVERARAQRPGMPFAAHVPDQLRSHVFRGSEAIEAGLLTRTQLESRAWDRLFRDVYRWRELPLSSEVRLEAARLAGDGQVLAGRTAAFARGTWTPPPGTLVPMEVARAKGESGTPLRGVARSRRVWRVDDEDIIEIDGVALTSPLRTAFDLTRTRHLVEAVVVIDAFANALAFTRRGVR